MAPGARGEEGGSLAVTWRPQSLDFGGQLRSTDFDPWPPLFHSPRDPVVPSQVR